MTQPAETGHTSDRQARLIDQAMSMHAALRDRAAMSSTSTTVALLSASVFSIAFAFAGDLDQVTIFGMTAQRSTWLGILSIIAFCGTLFELVSDRRGVARRHEAAVRLLAQLKDDYRKFDPDEQALQRRGRLSARYQAVMAELPAIPETKFNRLKSQHLLKIEVSKVLSANPGISERAARNRVRRSHA